MSVCVDTSAIVAVLDASDKRHSRAAVAWTDLVIGKREMVITSYAVVETAAVLQARYEPPAVRAFLEDLLPLMRVQWIDAALHEAAASMFLACVSRGAPSLVDCATFESIRRYGIQEVFAYDKHFTDRGFNLIG
ncbi:MAG: PIN domain-containing protein [Armatimonadota bacterium]|nr:PIN domain-containing protein [Armatimonadota bacterium]